MSLRKTLKSYGYIYAFLFAALVALTIYLNIYKLGNLVGGISNNELHTNQTLYGLHGLYHNATFLPINIIRSIIFKLFTPHDQTLLRLPSAIFGTMSVIFYYFIVYFWHGKRTAILSSLLITCAAFTLHLSRLATNDIVYFWGLMTLILSHALYYRYAENRVISLINYFVWGLLLTIPGFIYLVLLDVFLQRELVKENWTDHSLKIKSSQVLLLALWLPLLIVSVIKFHLVRFYFGLPQHFPNTIHILKNFGAVLVHLFVRGPQYPDLWLGRLPLLDFFTLSLFILGILFYISKRESSRSRLLGWFFLISFILVGLGGAVSFSLIVALAYITASTGIAYILHAWLKVFPNNPIARSLGIGLICLAILISCIYNLRSYFVAWRLNQTTVETFSRRL